MKKIFVVLAVAFTMGSINAYAAPAITTDAPATYAPATDAVDDLLNEYEKCVDKLIAAYKKWMAAYNAAINKGQAVDMAVMTEYATLVEQVAKVDEKIQKVVDSLTDAQLARYLKITQKLAAVI
ncbi:MAG: hypothetical protein IKL20_01120 [Alistipes sp.]|nr:hypothetical protein [Alistipes sp.]